LLTCSTQAKEILDDQVEYFQLENGLKVYLLSHKKAQNVHIEVDVGIGYDDENRSTYGLSYLIEHLVFRDKKFLIEIM